MRLTIDIKNQNKVATFLDALKQFDYIEIVNAEEGPNVILPEHKALLEERLKKIETGEAKFTNWDNLKKKYEKNPI